MIYVDEIKTTSIFGNDFVHIDFTLSPTKEDLSLYKFDLHRSNDSETGFVKIADNLTEFSHADEVDLYNIAIPFYYKVVVTKLSSGEASESKVYRHLAEKHDQYAYYISHLVKHNARVTVNNQVLLLLSRKRTGTLCPTCHDEIRKRPQQQCETCWNTGFVGGFYTPKKVIAVYNNASGIMEKFSPSNVAEDKTPVQLWTPNYPLIQVNDLLVDTQNTRFIVTSFQPSVKQFYLIRQTIQMQMIPKTSLLYKIPIGGDTP